MKLLLIRHAQSTRNVRMQGKVFYQDHAEKTGIPNRKVDLTETGIQEARELAKRILEMVREGELGLPDIVLHSGFVRAKRTAQIVTERMYADHAYSSQLENLTIKHNHLLRERDSGYGFEMTEQEARAHFPYLKSHWDFEGKWFSCPPGGESLVRVMDRATLLLHTLTADKRYEGKTVYAFTHGGFMMATHMVVENIAFDESALTTSPANCHIDMYTNEQGYWEKIK